MWREGEGRDGKEGGEGRGGKGGEGRIGIERNKGSAREVSSVSNTGST